MPATTKTLLIADLTAKENQCVTGFFAASNRQLRTKADGSSYLSLTLADASGQMEGRGWESKDAGEFHSGDIVKLRATVCRYQEKLQLKIDKLRRADPITDAGEYDLGDFVPKTACDIDALWRKLTGYVASFTDPHLQTLLQLFLADPAIAAALREAPAAKASLSTSPPCSTFASSPPPITTPPATASSTATSCSRAPSSTISASSTNCAGEPASPTRSRASCSAISPSAPP